MRDKKLLRLLACFDEQELKRLKLLVDSPYFNNEESVRMLLDYLLPYAPDFKHPKINYEDTFQHLFGSRPLQSDPKTAVGRIMYKLVQLVREFIAQETLSQQPVQKSIYQIQFLQRHSMVEYVPKLLEEADELLEASPHRNEYYFRQRLLLESENASYLNTVQDLSTPDYNLGKQNRALDAYYALSKLQMYCFAKNAELRTTVEFDYSQKPQLLDWIHRSGLLNTPSIHIWYLALCLLEAPDPARFQALKEAIRQIEGTLSPSTLRILYSYLANTARVVFTNRYAYFRALFDLYKEQLEQGVLHINNYLSPVMLRNVTIVGLKLREYDWVHQFLEDNAERIVPTYTEREDIVTLCRAYLCFEKKEFKQTLSLVNTLRYESVFTKMDERRIRLMCYYELKMYDSLTDLINSFRKFISAHKKGIPENYIQENRLFMNFVQRIVNTKIKSMREQRKLADKIRQVPVLPEKEWLLSKLEGIESPF